MISRGKIKINLPNNFKIARIQIQASQKNSLTSNKKRAVKT